MKQQDFARTLTGEEEIHIMVVRKGNRKKRVLPVWFVTEESTLHLLPMYGLKTRWFQDIEASGALQIRAREQKKNVSPKIVRDPTAVDRVKRLFGRKYGFGDARKYYPTSEVALEIGL